MHRFVICKKLVSGNPSNSSRVPKRPCVGALAPRQEMGFKVFNLTYMSALYVQLLHTCTEYTKVCRNV